MTKLHLDFETKSILNLKKVGVDNYARHPSTAVLMLAWAFDNDTFKLWEPHKDPELPREVRKALLKNVTKCAWNSNFERNILHHVLGIWVPYQYWVDPMIYARYLSLPGYLAKAGPILGLSGELSKMEGGKLLIDRFSLPFKMGGGIDLFGPVPPLFHDHKSHPDDWQRFGEYCLQDGVTEREALHVMAKLGVSELPPLEARAFCLDQKINDTGMPVNLQMVDNGLTLAQREKDEFKAQLMEMTGLKNPNSSTQLLPWLQSQGYAEFSLGKDIVARALGGSSPDLTPLARKVLTIRKNASKTSYTKLAKIRSMISSDGRLRNQFVFLGAARTGRWSGREVQLQNLARPNKLVAKNMDAALQMIRDNDYDGIKEKFGSVLLTIISCLRAMFQAPAGTEMTVCDLNAIENRGLGWLAGCNDILDVFKRGECPYLTFATKMYHVDYESLNAAYERKDAEAGERRQISKPAVLGAGYGLGSGVSVKHLDDGTTLYEAVLKQDSYGNIVKTGLMGYAENMGVNLTPEQAYLAHKVFREAYPEVTDKKTGLWRRLEDAAIKVIEKGGKATVGPVVFDRIRHGDAGTFIMRIKLPSGRHLHYMNARIEMRILKGTDDREYEKKAIVYDGFGHGVGKIKEGWGPVYTYGGKLTENIVQAISRDLLLNSLFLADEMCFEIIGHIHDEDITLTSTQDPFSPTLEDLRWCMMQPPDWAPDFVLGAEGYCSPYYKKN